MPLPNSPNTHFTDRFTRNNPVLEAVVLSGEYEQMSDEELAVLSPYLERMAKKVRQHSYFLTNTAPLAVVYQAITEHADPKISLRLAAKRDKNCLPILPTEELIKAAMFGIDVLDMTTYANEELNKLVEGVERVSAALAASHLIGRLSQVKEQFAHYKYIEQEALKDLDLLFDCRDVAALLESILTLPQEKAQSIYFEDGSFTLLPSEFMRVKIYLSSLNIPSWQEVITYTGGQKVETLDICANVVDYINAKTLEAKDGSTLAVLRPNITTNIHEVQFEARYRDLVVTTEVVSIQFEFSSDQMLPFKWGANLQTLHSRLYGSIFIAIDKGTVQVLATPDPEKRLAPTDKCGDVTVVYFRRVKPIRNDLINQDQLIINSAEWQQASYLTYRISPTKEDQVVIDIPYLTDPDPAKQEALDRNRPSQVALAFLNSINNIHQETKMLGALFRNDNAPTVPMVEFRESLSPEPYPNYPTREWQKSDLISGVELIAFTAMNPEVYLVLDILQIPADIEIAIGDLCHPNVLFSNKPKSARVKTHYQFQIQKSNDQEERPILDYLANPLFKKKESALLRKIKQDVNTQTGRYDREAILRKRTLRDITPYDHKE